MLPWYSPAHQRTQLDRMKDQARKLVAAWAALPDDEPLDARAWMERYTLEVSGRGACAYDFGLLASDGTSGGTGDGRPHPFAAAVPASTKESILRVADPRPDFTLFAGRTRRARRKAYRRHNKELFRTADALVRARMHTCPLGPQTDLLSRLVSTPDPETGEFLDAETIRDQILMHLSNGFNGPSITAAWLAYVLATHPDVEEKLIAEIDGITGGDPGLRPALRRPDGAAVHHRGDQGDDADLPADAGHHPAQPQGRDARPLPDQEGRHHPGRHARRAARPALLGPGAGPVRPGAVHHGQDRRPAAARLHPVLDREAAVHGAGGHVHDAPRRAVRDLPALPAPARAGRDRGQERGGDDQAGRGPGHPGAARGDRPGPGAGPAPGRPAVAIEPDRSAPVDARAGASRPRSRRPAPTGTWSSRTAATSARARNWPNGSPSGATSTATPAT